MAIKKRKRNSNINYIETYCVLEATSSNQKQSESLPLEKHMRELNCCNWRSKMKSQISTSPRPPASEKESASFKNT